MDTQKDSLESEDESIFKNPWTLDDFLIGKPLGKGRFGRIFLAKETRTKFQHLVALKFLFKKALVASDTIENFKRECEFQLSFNHPNIVKMYGWFHDERRIIYILEYVPNGNLFDKLQNGPFDNVEAATYIYQIANALIYIHSKNIVHRDLKPENVLLGYKGEAKLCDFGWSNLCFKENNIENALNCKSLAGTYDYLCPEIIEDKGHDIKVDNWCLGVLCYELLTGKVPFGSEASNTDELLLNIKNVKFCIPANLDRSARLVIQKLIVKNPLKRLELTDLLNEEWIRKFSKID